MIAPDLGKQLGGQAVIVDNKPGASGNIGAAYVAKSAPDGHTLLVGYSMFHVGNPSMFKDLAWDPGADFASVAMVAVSPTSWRCIRPCPAQTLKDLVDLAKKEPGKLNYASPGSGSVPHVGMELFKQQTGIDIVTCRTRAPGR
jgi:tripartite-type tricarboxylate transporter receptor subunit TctC